MKRKAFHLLFSFMEVSFIDFCFSEKPSLASERLAEEIYGPLAERDEIEIRE